MMVTGDTPHGSRKAHLLGQALDRGQAADHPPSKAEHLWSKRALQRMLTGIERVLYVLSQAIGQELAHRRTKDCEEYYVQI